MKLKILQQVIVMSKYAVFGTILQFILINVIIASPGNAQKMSIEKIHLSISTNHATIEQVFDKVEHTTDFSFAFNKSILKRQKEFSMNFDQVSLADLLRFISKKADLRFKRVDETIHVYKKNSSKGVLSEHILIDDKRYAIISGRVTDETSEPLPGVNVVEKGTTNGTVTDPDGNYQISVPEGSTLVFSSIGYISTERPVTSESTINVSLSADITKLSEIVVVGYGTQERANVTGALSSVKGEDLSSLPSVGVDHALQGRAAGVTVLSAGAPGSRPLVRIRGLGTFGNGDPLYVVNGVPTSNINDINPNSVESVEVLKDAATAAIYGSRGSNGVILITTKKGVPGASGKPQFSFDAYYGTSNIGKTLDLLNVEQYTAYASEYDADTSVPGNQLPSRLTDPQWASFLTETDWQDEVFQSGTIQSYNLGVSGGSETANYSLNAGYFDQEGIIIGTGFERYSFGLNSGIKVTDKLELGQTLSLGISTRDKEGRTGGTGRTLIEHMIKIPPYLPVIDPNDPNGGYKETDMVDFQDGENPVRFQLAYDDVDRVSSVLGSFYAQYEIIKGLKFKSQIGLDLNYNNNTIHSRSFTNGEFVTQTFAQTTQNTTRYLSTVFTNSLDYSVSLEGGHNINATIVAEQQKSTSNFMSGVSNNTLTDEIPEVSFPANNLFSNTTKYSIISYIGRVNYNYKDRYLIGASIRRDGSSRFGPNNKWGSFPSVSAAWRISNEQFMQTNGLVSNLKVRASWGKAGNDGIGNYLFQSGLLTTFNYILQDGNLLNGVSPFGLSNPDLKWEEVTMTNVGLDIGILQDQITASFEYYNNKNDDLLLFLPTPASLGVPAGNAPTNIASVKTEGFEFNLGYKDVEGDLKWSASLNLGTSKNEATSLGNSVAAIQNAPFEADNLNRIVVGDPLYHFYGWQTDGLFQNQSEIDNHATQPGAEPGDIRFKDINGDGVINAEDKTSIGDPNPDLTYGLNLSASYKGFDLTVFFSGVKGIDIYNTTRYDLEGMTRLFNSGTAVLNRWTGEGTSTTIPRAAQGDPNGNTRVSDRFVEDGSFTKLRNITLGYTLPSQIQNKLGLGQIRFYVSGQNLFTITDYSGYDPEIGSRVQSFSGVSEIGIDRGFYPQPRSVIGGIKLTF